MDRSFRPEKKKKELNCTIDQMDANVHLQNSPSTSFRIYIFLQVHGNFSRMGHMLSHKTNIKIFKGLVKWLK
jgi:hypothetical protein